MSHATKILLKVILLKSRNKVRQEISEEQYGFMDDMGIRIAIFVLRLMAERAIEMQKDLCICFIDYAKALKKVRHKNVMLILNNLNIDGKDLTTYIHTYMHTYIHFYLFRQARNGQLNTDVGLPSN